MLAGRLPLLPFVAALVSVPPPDSREVGVLVCAAEACDDRAFWVTHEPALQRVPVVTLDTIIAEEATTVAQGEAAGAAFRVALEEARVAAVEARWSACSAALSRAESTLGGWRGSPPNEELVALWLLRGVSAAAAGRDGADAFRTAAVLAWNRSVRLPAGLEAGEAAYLAAVEALLGERVGVLVIEAPAEPVEVYLDGVPLGAPPVRVEVYGGVHRVSARSPRRGTEWSGPATVRGGVTTTLRPRFSGTGEAEALADSLAETVLDRRLDPAVGDLLHAWAERHQVATLRLLRLDPVGGPGGGGGDAAGDAPIATYTLTSVRYAPGLRRFSSD